ncbi:MAG TPA: FxsA family protein [Solirubrobacteraceae bacterium]|nr:FxsA family protein [Solirubrobacteraceae bacterium]
MRRSLFPFALFVIFVVVPIAELAVIIWTGTQIGVAPTIAILILDSILGAWLLRTQGRGAWRRFNDALAAGRPPAREVLDGGLIIFGAAFLLTPGFLTDIVGILLLVPPTRAVFRRLLVRRFSRRFLAGLSARTFGGGLRGGGRGPRPGGPGGGFGGGPGRGPSAPRQPYDVDGSAVDLDAPQIPRR